MHADEQLVGEREHGHSRRVLCLVIRLSKYGFVAMVQVSPNGDPFGSKRPQSNATSIRSDKRISPVPHMVRMSTICTGRAARLWREKSIEKG